MYTCIRLEQYFRFSMKIERITAIFPPYRWDLQTMVPAFFVIILNCLSHMCGRIENLNCM